MENNKVGITDDNRKIYSKLKRQFEKLRREIDFLEAQVDLIKIRNKRNRKYGN